jgi:hypothetical protein
MEEVQNPSNSELSISLLTPRFDSSLSKESVVKQTKMTVLLRIKLWSLIRNNFLNPNKKMNLFLRIDRTHNSINVSYKTDET